MILFGFRGMMEARIWCNPLLADGQRAQLARVINESKLFKNYAVALWRCIEML